MLGLGNRGQISQSQRLAGTGGVDHQCGDASATQLIGGAARVDLFFRAVQTVEEEDTWRRSFGLRGNEDCRQANVSVRYLDPLRWLVGQLQVPIKTAQRFGIGRAPRGVGRGLQAFRGLQVYRRASVLGARAPSAPALLVLDGKLDETIRQSTPRAEKRLRRLVFIVR